jgi:hypothetical protein
LNKNESIYIKLKTYVKNLHNRRSLLRTTAAIVLVSFYISQSMTAIRLSAQSTWRKQRLS